MKPTMILGIALLPAMVASLAGELRAAAAAAANYAIGAVTVTSVSGTVTSQIPGQRRAPAVAGGKFGNQTIIETREESAVQLAMPDGNSLQGGAWTRFMIEEYLIDAAPPTPPSPTLPRKQSKTAAPSSPPRSASRTKLVFEGGELEIKVQPLRFDLGALFTVETPAGMLGVRGTHFRLRTARMENKAVQFTLEVIEGMVAFAAKTGGVVNVVPGQPYQVTLPGP